MISTRPTRPWPAPRRIGPSLSAVGLPVVAVVIAACGGGQSPTAESSPACRQWASRVVSSWGTTYECRAGGGSATCSGYLVDITWRWASLEDFVREVEVPNRLLVLERSQVSCGSWAYLGCNHSLVEYSYDGQGRLLARARSAGSTQSEDTIVDVTAYSAWDARGRPTAGVVEADGRRQTIGITYDDDARLMEVTNGELVQQDRYGNTIREVTVWGIGRTEPWETTYRVESLQAVCLAR